MDDWPKLLKRTYDAIRPAAAGINTAQMDRPTPCTEWKLGDLFEHVVNTIDMFATAAGASAAAGTQSSTPLDRFDAAAARNLTAWNSVRDSSVILSLPFGDFSAEQAAGINQMDSLIHGWDIAASLGMISTWPADVTERAMSTADERFRTRTRATFFGPEVPAHSATTQERLLALSGRDTSPWGGVSHPVTPVRVVYGKLPAQDIDRARNFYRDKLGFTPFLDHSNHLYYQVNGAHFMIFPSMGHPSGTHDQLGFVVDDLVAEVTRLRAAGIVFENYDIPGMHEEIMDAGHMKAAWFTDSEGNLISVAQFVGHSPFMH